MDRYSKDLARSVLERAENVCRSYHNVIRIFLHNFLSDMLLVTERMLE